MKKLLFILGMLFSCLLPAQPTFVPAECDIGIAAISRVKSLNETLLSKVSLLTMCIGKSNPMFDMIPKCSAKLHFLNRSQRRTFHRAIKSGYVKEKQYQVMCDVWRQNKLI